jgi:hypothetical protein
MTAKEQLREYVAGLSEDEAVSLWQRIQFEEDRPLRPGEVESIRRGLADMERADLSELEDVERELGLN